MWVCTTHLADAGITDEKELEKIVVLAGMHGDQVSKAEGSDGGQDVVERAADEGGGGVGPLAVTRAALCDRQTPLLGGTAPPVRHALLLQSCGCKFCFT